MIAVICPAVSIFETLATKPPARRALVAGERLFRAGDRVKGMYVIAVDRLQLVRTSIGGSEVTLYRAGAGESFVEPSLFSERYHCDAVAETASEVLVYSKADIIRGLRDDPGRMMILLRHFGGQVQALRARAQMLSVHSATERLMCYFRLQMPVGENVMTLDLTWKQVAGEIGLTHEALYRALARLDRDGKIQRKGRTLELTGR